MRGLQEYISQVAGSACVSAGAGLLNETTHATTITASTSRYVPRATLPTIAFASLFFCRIVEGGRPAGASLIFG
jgi:hypothetical protein